MARVQVDSSVRAEALQSFAAPRLQGVQARFDPGSDKASQLAAQLSKIVPASEEVLQSIEKRQEKEAMAYAGSLSAEQLGNQIKSGELANYQSPIFVATVKRIYGENTANAVSNQIADDLKNQNVSFNSDAELDAYINKKRVEALSGVDKFTVAGFDSKFNTIRAQLNKQNTALVSKRMADEAESNMYQNAKDTYNEYRATPEATAEGTIGQMVGRYQAYRRDGLLPSVDKQREALINIATIAAENKDKPFLDKWLKTDLGDGVTVERVLGVNGLDKINSAIDKIQTSQYYRKQREKSDAMDMFTDEIEARLAAGKGIKDIVSNEEKYGVLSQTQRTKLANQIGKGLSDGGTFTRARLQEIADSFDGITDPQEAVYLKGQLLARAGSKEERAAIQTIYTQGKFQNPDSDPGFTYGKQVVQSNNKSNDFVIGSDNYFPAFKKYQDEWGQAFYMKSSDLYAAHSDVIPEQYKDRSLAQQPIEIKRKVAKKIADAGAVSIGGKNPSGGLEVSESARPVNPNSPKVPKPGEAIKQNGITISVEKDK